MVIVAEEKPLVAVVNDDNLNTVCSNCFAVKSELNKIDLIKCDNCRVINYCSKKCQEEDWKLHEDECQFIGKSGKFHSKDRMMSRLTMRVRQGGLPVAFNGRTFEDLMDHKDEIEKDIGRYNQMKVAYGSLVQFMGPENAPSFEEFLSYSGKRLINAFGIGYTGILQQHLSLGTGLYLGLATHDHSCRPTADYHFNGTKIVLCTDDPNATYSKDLTICYISIRTTVKEDRQKKLRAQFYFDCGCDRCADEETDLLERSGRSACCPTEGAVLPVDKRFQFLGYWRQPLVCTNCGKKADTTVEQINEHNKTVADLCMVQRTFPSDVHCQEDVDELIRLLAEAELFLSPYNLNLIEFTGLVMRAAETVDKTSPLLGKYISTEDKVLEKYSLSLERERISTAVNRLKRECAEACNNPREIAFAQIDAACQKALDVVKEAYGSDHSLCKEIGQFSGLNKSLYQRAADNKEEKTEEKMIADEEDKKTIEGENDY